MVENTDKYKGQIAPWATQPAPLATAPLTGKTKGADIAPGASLPGQNPPTPQNSTTQTPPPTKYPYTPGGIPANPDPVFSTALNNIAPKNTQTDEEFFQKVYSQLQPAINAANDAEIAAETAANLKSTRQSSANNFSLGARGLAGSSEADSMAIDNANERDVAIAQAKADQAAKIGDLTKWAIPEAHSEYLDALTRNDTNSQAYIKQKQTDLSNSLAGLASMGISLSDLQTSNPQEYANLLQFANGDPNILTDMYISAASANKKLLNNGQPLTQIGNQLTYGVQSIDANGNPIISTITQKLPFDLPATYGWVANKVGTTLTVMTDPNNAANTISYATDPFTGKITISGTGTGLQALQAAGIANGSQVDSSGQPTSSTGAGDPSITMSTNLGIDRTSPLSDVVSSVGIGSIVAQIIKNEGGSPTGVKNNPGNIKFTGAPGQTDSGVKASDGGTYASYPDTTTGQQAIASLIQSAANGQLSEYGQNPTFQSFINTYTNTSPSTTTASGLDAQEYGLLSNVQGFDPTKPGIDQSAFNYLKQYLTQGKTPTASSVGLSTRTGQGQAFNQVAQRAADLYFKATGKQLPNATTLSNNLNLVSNNNTLLNNLKVQEETINKNFGLNLENLTDNSINQSAPIINGILDKLSVAAGNTSIAQYLTQNETIKNELGSLLSLKNASGTTVADKMSAENLLASNLSADQQKAILNILMKEAGNAQQSIGKANADLYQQTDPLGLDPNNPVNAPGYKQLTSQNFSDNYDGTWTDPSGNSGYTVQNGVLVSPDESQSWSLTQ